ncbi:MAG: Sua5/YciO/YrdC/YwlC family protein [Microgenomates bacterium 39_7]|nr:MAG: Sua5/YciO/YrdC/YwlC family protein [Microgenomates bacterium 39_7]
MEIIKLNQKNCQQTAKHAAEVLKKGGLVIFPTETVYGIGADATNQQAILKLLSYKSRREGKPLSIAVTDQLMAEQFVELNEQAKNLYQRFLPGPYTIVSRYKNGLADGVASEFNTLGVRIPDHKLALDIVRNLKQPITATSANASGKKRPYAVTDILKNLSNKQKALIDLIIDAGELPPNEPSVVIDTTLSTPLTLRSSGSPQDKSSKKSIKLISHSEKETQEIAGKLLLKHWDQLTQQGLIIGLDGELGAGKTVFAKGVGNFLRISSTITSPTYSYIREYDFTRYQTEGKLFHIDVWKVDDPQVLEKLQIPALLAPNHLIVIEWWTQLKDSLAQFQANLNVRLELISENERSLTIIENPSS